MDFPVFIHPPLIAHGQGKEKKPMLLRAASCFGSTSYSFFPGNFVLCQQRQFCSTNFESTDTTPLCVVFKCWRYKSACDRRMLCILRSGMCNAVVHPSKIMFLCLSLSWDWDSAQQQMRGWGCVESELHGVCSGKTDQQTSGKANHHHTCLLPFISSCMDGIDLGLLMFAFQVRVVRLLLCQRHLQERSLHCSEGYLFGTDTDSWEMGWECPCCSVIEELPATSVKGFTFFSLPLNLLLPVSGGLLL